jgi:hypothetical protein
VSAAVEQRPVEIHRNHSNRHRSYSTWSGTRRDGNARLTFDGKTQIWFARELVGRVLFHSECLSY